jgi:predicted TIM-barrel fold metal-dependent hydrolase
MLNRIGVFDSHFHIIDSRFPLIANHGYLPDEFSCDDYLLRMKDYSLCGGAIVSGSFQQFDQTYLLDALQKLGTSFVGVTQLPVTVSDEEIFRLNTAGVRAIRFNLKRGGSEDISRLTSVAWRVFELAGWHIELYIDSAELIDLDDTLVNLPAVSIDHLGLSQSGLKHLTKLAEKDVRVKASGFGRVDFDVKTALKDIYSVNPEALMFGTDLPSTRAPRPYRDEDVALIVDTLGDDGADRVLHRNAINFYRLKKAVEHT